MGGDLAALMTSASLSGSNIKLEVARISVLLPASVISAALRKSRTTQ